MQGRLLCRAGGVWHEATVLVCLPLAAPIGLSPLHILGGGGGRLQSQIYPSPLEIPQHKQETCHRTSQINPNITQHNTTQHNTTQQNTNYGLHALVDHTGSDRSASQCETV